MSSERILIFDFDGTIVDSKQVYYHAVEKHLTNLGFNKKQIDNAIDIGLSISMTLKKIGFSKVMAFFIKRRIMKDVLKKVNEIKKCKDVSSIKDLKIKKILVSNSFSEFILPVLKHLKLNFDEIYGGENFEDKEEFISSYLERNNINKKECYYVREIKDFSEHPENPNKIQGFLDIGDRVADIKLARHIGIKSIIISGKCSWDSRAELLKANPDFILDDLKNVSDII